MIRAAPRVPFQEEGRIVVAPAAPSAAVRILASRRDLPRATLLRLYRAVGEAADRGGVGPLVDVRLRCGRRSSPPTAEVGPAGARLTVHLDHARSSPTELERLVAAALNAAGPGPATRPARVARAARRSPGRVLLMENPFVDPDHPDRPRPEIAGGSFALASSLRAEGVVVQLVGGRYHRERGLEPWMPMSAALADEPPDLVGITVLEGCLDAVRTLCDRLAGGWGGHVVLGGPLPTLTPIQALAHVPGAQTVLRGPGEARLPVLARLLRGGRPDAAVQRALLAMDGLLYEREGLLLAGHTGRVPDPPLTDRRLDFSLLQRRHLTRGLSLETARGCTHACPFCTTPGRGGQQGLDGEGVACLLTAYGAHLSGLFDGDPPRIARRIQICDDDFCCDRDRARDVASAVADSGFQLAALQASVRDFLLRDGEKVSVDDDLLDALTPGLFQDASERRAWPAGKAPVALSGDAGGWIHLGVESLADADLRRLGKGYRAADVRALVEGLDRRGIVHDVYLILANRGTTLDDLVDSLLAVADLKLAFPETFFLRIPVVPFLVPVYPSARFASLARGLSIARLGEHLELDGIWSETDHPELDYPRVIRELPSDPDVQAACEAWPAWLDAAATATSLATGLERWLREHLPTVVDPGRRRRVRRAIRRLHRAGRRLVFGRMARARRGELPPRVADRIWAAAADLGPAPAVAREARTVLESGDPRLVLIPTRDCSLRCTYCPADKRAGHEMDRSTLDEAVELLLSTDADAAILQFFGGEALLLPELVLPGIERALARARQLGKRLGVILSTNGLALDAALLDRIADWPVKIELSIDGPREVHTRHRLPAVPTADSYALVRRAVRALVESTIDHEVIMVVTPDTVARMADSFAHIADLGLRAIQVNYALAARWSRADKQTFAAQLSAIEERYFAGDELPPLEWINLRSFRDPMLLNGELTVDFDGTLYHGNGFLIRTAEPASFRAGDLGDLGSFDSLAARRPDNATLVELTYPEDVARDNRSVGRIYGSFVRHLRGRFPELSRVAPTLAPSSGAQR